MQIKPNDPISKLDGIGPQKVELFQKLGIKTIKDLLNHFPFRYEDTSKVITIENLQFIDEIQTIRAEIISIKNFYTKNGKKLTTAIVADNTAQVEAIWFNQHFLTQILRPGRKVLLSGKMDLSEKPKLISPKYELVWKSREPAHLARITPVYSETKGLTSKLIRKIFKDIDSFWGIEKLISETLPQKIIKQNGLISLPQAYKFLHFPQKKSEIEQGKKRMAFEEIYQILTKAESQRKNNVNLKSPKIKQNKKLVENFLKNLEFTPTHAQIRSINETLSDTEKSTPMNRLLEGDVGSGKTLVAMAAILNAISDNFQTVILAPTQVLAKQHFETFKQFTPWLKKDLALITADSKQQEKFKKEKIVIGTHAILYQAAELFENLGLVVIDEQHRFGVRQREFLTEFVKDLQQNKRKDVKVPHVLTMTATPIPRSLALTIFGEIEISVIDELPPGRIPIQTHVVPNEKRKASYKWIKEQVKQDGQIFIICPLIDASEKIQVKSAIAEYEHLSKNIFPELKIALLHGKIRSEEKNKILADFKNRQYDILVSTAVVEVGIDIPDATVMVIEGAERFGLAQLHQFRGRVGRSDKKSYCLLFTENESVKTLERLKYFASTNNGMNIAEYDLKRRGPGEVYGIKQAGIPELRFANIMDLELIKRVRKAIERF